MARFLGGLSYDIANVVELQRYVELDDMVHMAIKMDKQLKRKGCTQTRQNWWPSSTWKLNQSKKDEKRNFKPKAETFKENKNEGVLNQGKSDS